MQELHRGKQSVVFPNFPAIEANAAIVGKKEGEGPLREDFDQITQDTKLNQASWEKAESELQKTALELALGKASLNYDDLDVLFAGDLLNQCISSSFAVRDTRIPFLGLYGACSTMAESLLLAASFVNAGYARRAGAITSSHFASAERQYRFPLGYGGQRTPTAQWTVTGSGCCIVSSSGKGPFVECATVGKIQDFGIKDANNMGAAMAPAAVDTIRQHFEDFGRRPQDYDLIVTGDLGVLGKQIVYVEEDGASEPSTFATKAEKLIDSEKVATVFGGWTSSSRKAVKPVFEDYNALLWYPVQYEGMEQSPNIVYTGAAPNQQIVPAIEYLLDKGYKKFFLLGSDYVFPRTANMIITAQVKAAGGEVVGEEYADMDQTDFAAIISKIEAAQPEIIINTLNGTGNVSFFKQMAEKNYTSAEYPTMSFSIAEEEVATIGADILKGHMVSWNYYETTDTPENKAFVEAYKAKFGESRVTSDPAEAAYDAVYLWKAACEKAGSFDVDAVKEAIAGGDISFNAPEGTVTINGTNQHLTKPVRIGEIRDDGLIYEVYSTPTAVDPDPYLTTYDWAVEAGIQPIE